ncbi:MAG: serine O-acetyltransferase [Bacteroidales bacterium]|nr:serine O-acetyltransferase [Bacteroidales bacterium]
MANTEKNRAENISEVLKNLQEAQHGMKIDRPSKKQAKDFTDLCFNILFPINARKTRCNSEDEAEIYRLDNMLTSLLLPVKNDLKYSISEICQTFISKLPETYIMLMKDAKAICDFDPASSNLDEVIITYPGFFAISAYRIAHILKKLEVPLIPRLISEYAHSETGIDINPGAEIGESFFIDHGTGIVIGETTIIKNNVKIYQGVTLGALQVKKELASTKRHPTVEDNVIIYSNATILGGETVIGKDCIIGGNVWITSSVPEGMIVYHTNQIRLKPQSNDKKLKEI